MPRRLDNDEQLYRLAQQLDAVKERAKKRDEDEVARYAKEQEEAAKRTAEAIRRNEEARAQEAARLAALQREQDEIAELRRRKADFDRLDAELAAERAALAKAKAKNAEQRKEIERLNAERKTVQGERSALQKALDSATLALADARRKQQQAEAALRGSALELDAAKRDAARLAKLTAQRDAALDAKAEADERADAAAKALAEAEAKQRALETRAAGLDAELSAARDSLAKLDAAAKASGERLAEALAQEAARRGEIIAVRRRFARYVATAKLEEPFERFDRLASDAQRFKENLVWWSNHTTAASTAEGFTPAMRAAAQRYLAANPTGPWPVRKANVHVRLAWLCRQLCLVARSDALAALGRRYFPGNTGSAYRYRVNAAQEITWPERPPKDLTDAAKALGLPLLVDDLTYDDKPSSGANESTTLAADIAANFDKAGGMAIVADKYAARVPHDFLLSVLYMCFSGEALQSYRTNWAIELAARGVGERRENDAGLYFRPQPYPSRLVAGDEVALFALLPK